MSTDSRLMKIRDGIQEGLLIGLDIADGLADGFPGPAKALFVEIKIVLDLVDQFTRNKEDWESLRAKLQDITDTVAKAIFGYDPDTLPTSLLTNIGTMNKVLDGIQIEVEKAQQRKGWERVLLLKRDRKVIQDLIGRLHNAVTRLNFQEHISHTLSLHHLTLSVHQINSKQELTWLKEALASPVQITLGDSCLEGTRESLISKILGWVNNPAAPNIFWLSASPGAGKTAIASTIVRKTGACRYFFRHTDSVSQNPLQFWHTVAGELVNQYAVLRADISNAVKEIQKQEQRVEDLDLHSQFQQLIKSPLKTYYDRLSHTQASKQQVLLLVVDVLDEANREDKRLWAALLRTLAEWSQLPGIFRLIVTSRPYDDIKHHLAPKCQKEILATGKVVSSETRADIERYLRSRFDAITSQIQEQQPNIPSSWPGKDIISQMANQAAGLFMWVKAALDHIEGGGNPMQRLQEIQNSSGVRHLKGLDGLYITILQTIYGNLEEEEKDILQKVLWTIIIAKQPIDLLSLEEIIHAPACSLWWVEQALRPILVEKNNHLLQSCHKSFTDFMLEKKRSGNFTVDQKLHGLYIPLEGHTDSVISVAFSPDTTKVASASRDNILRVWDISTGLSSPLEGHQQFVHSVSFSPDGTKIVSGSWDSTIRVWDVSASLNMKAGDVGESFLEWTWDSKSGWILTKNGKVPIAWIPNILWSGFHSPSTCLIIGAHETVLDFSDYIPWEEWKI
ncbi:hypothetical protein M422DRAFT_257873 [Sphaerobolus stellatus SS14]|uniref:Nephrocystin 3-like N-terminal domain-containing protein n=1 Tax=Sphaerobolus stellatus (strain SS14) TaxID=990650 RepID=A0A0C9U8A8_SPHS4|nr:hypothetical protein M422DRAFT_257873 [Sphaerobolus stellatus SS14]